MKRSCYLQDADLKIDGKSTRDRLHDLEMKVLLLTLGWITQILLTVVIITL